MYEFTPGVQIGGICGDIGIVPAVRIELALGGHVVVRVADEIRRRRRSPKRARNALIGKIPRQAGQVAGRTASGLGERVILRDHRVDGGRLVGDDAPGDADVLELHLRVGVRERELSREAVAGEVPLIELELDAVITIDADRNVRHEVGSEEGLLLPVVYPRVVRGQLEAHVGPVQMLLERQVVLRRRDARNRVERRVESEVQCVVPHRAVIAGEGKVLHRCRDRRRDVAAGRCPQHGFRIDRVGARETRLPVVQAIRTRRSRREVRGGNAVLRLPVGMHPAGLGGVRKSAHALITVAVDVLGRRRRRFARSERGDEDLICRGLNAGVVGRHVGVELRCGRGRIGQVVREVVVTYRGVQ